MSPSARIFSDFELLLKNITEFTSRLQKHRLIGERQKNLVLSQPLFTTRILMWVGATEPSR